MDYEEKFYDFVYPDPNTGCFWWTGRLKDSGYGLVNYKGRRRLAHRVAMEMAGFNIDGSYVLHKCHNRQCVNLDHLYLGDHNDNMRDMANVGSTKGERHWNCSLSDDDITECFRMRFKEGRQVNQIADDFSVTPKYMSAILSGKKRKKLTESLLEVARR